MILATTLEVLTNSVELILKTQSIFTTSAGVSLEDMMVSQEIVVQLRTVSLSDAEQETKTATWDSTGPLNQNAEMTQENLGDP